MRLVDALQPVERQGMKLCSAQPGHWAGGDAHRPADAVAPPRLPQERRTMRTHGPRRLCDPSPPPLIVRNSVGVLARSETSRRVFRMSPRTTLREKYHRLVNAIENCRNVVMMPFPCEKACFFDAYAKLRKRLGQVCKAEVTGSTPVRSIFTNLSGAGFHASSLPLTTAKAQTSRQRRSLLSRNQPQRRLLGRSTLVSSGFFGGIG